MTDLDEFKFLGEIWGKLPNYLKFYYSGYMDRLSYSWGEYSDSRCAQQLVVNDETISGFCEWWEENVFEGSR